MGLINLDSIINKSTFLSKSKKFLSSLDSSVGSNEDIKPKYIYPNDIDKQSAANYMIIYIYDNVNNNVEFQPMSTQIAKSKVQKDLIKGLTDCVSIKIGDKLKSKLKSYENDIKNYIEESFKDIFSKDGLKGLGDKLGIDLDFETPEWVNNVEDFLKDNQLTRSIKSLTDEFDLPDIKDWIDIDIDGKALKQLAINKITGASDFDVDKSEFDNAGNGFDLVSSIVLPLPINGINYNSKIGIESTSTKTASAIKSVVDAALNANGVFSGVVAGAKQGIDVIKAQKGELLYSMLGEGGSALYQQNFGQIRDPLLAFTYSIPDPRTFQYEFLMAPRSKQELYDIWNIIKTLKFYAHMSIQNDAKGTVRYYNFPGRFKIKYYTEGNENVWLGKTKILGLTNIETNIDTTNIGFILNDFDNISGNPPKLIALTMTFTELGILNRDDINGGF